MNNLPAIPEGAKTDLEKGLTRFEVIRTQVGGAVELVESIEITSDETYSGGADAITQVRKILKEGEAHRLAVKAPFFTIAKRVDDYAKEILGPLNTAYQGLRHKMSDYATEIEKRRREEQRKLDEAILRTAEKAKERGDETTAETVLQKGAEKTVGPTRVLSGKTSTSNREVYDSYVVIDIRAVPVQFLTVNEGAVRALAGQQLRDGKRPRISGLEIKTRQVVAVTDRH